MPTSGSQVCITTAGTYTVELAPASTGSISALTIGAGSGTQTLQIDATAELTAATTLNQTGGAIANQGTFVVASSFTQENGTTSNNPIPHEQLVPHLPGTAAASFRVNSVGYSVVSGNWSPPRGSSWPAGTAHWNGPATNAGTISASGNGGTLVVDNGTLTNTGLIRANAGNTGTFTLVGPITNQGTSRQQQHHAHRHLTNAGSLTIAAGATFANSNTFSNNAGGSIANSGTFTNNVFFHQNEGTTSGNPILLNNSYLYFPAGGGGGAAAFTVTNVGYSVVSGSSSATETIELASGTAHWNGPSTNAGTLSASGSGGTLVVDNGTLTNTGVIRADAGNTGTFSLVGPLANQGSILDNSSITLTGTLTNAGSLAIAFGATFTNSNTITNTAGGSIANSGTFTNNTYFTITRAPQPRQPDPDQQLVPLLPGRRRRRRRGVHGHQLRLLRRQRQLLRHRDHRAGRRRHRPLERALHQRRNDLRLRQRRHPRRRQRNAHQHRPDPRECRQHRHLHPRRPLHQPGHHHRQQHITLSNTLTNAGALTSPPAPPSPTTTPSPTTPAAPSPTAAPSTNSGSTSTRTTAPPRAPRLINNANLYYTGRLASAFRSRTSAPPT